MFTVFVLGNIASGKSTACRYLESHGAMLIDLDELAKSLYVPGLSLIHIYSQFMHGLKVAGIELDRKVLAQMAYEDIESFNELATIAKKALEA